MADKVIIRRIEKGEIDSIISISQSIVGKDRSASWQQSIESSLSVYPMKCLVAEVEGKIVGFLIGDTSNWEYGLPPCAWIQMVGVNQEYQHKGIGRMLVQEFGKRCKQEGLRSVQALIREDDERLLKFFSTVGFSGGKLINLEYTL